MDKARLKMGSVPVRIAARVYGRDPAWVRAGIIAGWLPIGEATRNGKRITDVQQMNSKLGRISYYISPKLELEKHKLELEIAKADDDKFIRILTTVTSIGATIAGLAVGSHWYGKGFKFEETGTICSSTFKGIMRDFKFFKK